MLKAWHHCVAELMVTVDLAADTLQLHQHPQLSYKKPLSVRALVAVGAGVPGPRTCLWTAELGGSCRPHKAGAIP